VKIPGSVFSCTSCSISRAGGVKAAIYNTLSCSVITASLFRPNKATGPAALLKRGFYSLVRTFICIESTTVVCADAK
jgi:hypothetical protein